MDINFTQKTNQHTLSQRLLLALDEATNKLEAIERSKNEPIAIIGMGCRFPGKVKDPETFWTLLRDGVDAITEVPSERWDLLTFYNPDPNIAGKIYTRYGGFLEQVKFFEPQFFGLTPREAMNMDPQQRLLLEVSWEALEKAGQAPSDLVGSRTGIFLGIGQNDYARLQLYAGDPTQINAYTASGNGFCFASGRLSYILGLQGPNLAIDTACSSSLVALHLACQSLRAKECDLALAGGVHLILSPEVTIGLSRIRALSPDGRCKTFDASADGYGRGEGCGIIVCKRLSDAIANKDRILALIRGSAVNHDGPSSGLTVPNGVAQQMLIRQALQNAKVAPSEINYVECHGTGTSLGDPIELEALNNVLKEGRNPETPLIVSSVKTNIGHLEAAAGIASLIKMVLALQNQEIPPHLHFNQPNPYINWDELIVKVPKNRIPWKSQGKSRISGISSFGISGTNAHVILEEAPLQTSEKNPIERPIHLLTLSAKTESALKQIASQYQEFINNHPSSDLSNICFTANTGRSVFPHRLSIIADSLASLKQQLIAFANQEQTTEIKQGQSSVRQAKIAFLFTGQGSQYVDMGRQLYETQPTFRKTLKHCEEVLRLYLDKPLLEILYPQLDSSDLESANLDQTAYTQPALFALEYSLAKLWQSWGITPTFVMGHSVGEYVAACVAEVFSLEDGLKLIAKRGQLMQSLPQDGKMAAVFASATEVTSAIKPYQKQIAIAAFNGSQNTVISGQKEAVDKVIYKLESAGIETKLLKVSHAFHSPAMDSILAEFEPVARSINYSSPRFNLISNLTGQLIKSEIATPEYWCSHLREPVNFVASMQTLMQRGCDVFLEIGPKPVLLNMGRRCLPADYGTWLPSLRMDQSDWQSILQSLSTLYVQGIKINWKEFDSDYGRHRIELPTYPFNRQSYWVDKFEYNTYSYNNNSNKFNNRNEKKLTNNFELVNEENIIKIAKTIKSKGSFSASEAKIIPKILEILLKENKEQIQASTSQDWLYQVQWKPQIRQFTKILETPQISQTGTWLIFADQQGIGIYLAQELEKQGYSCLLIYIGETYQVLHQKTWSLNPHNSDELFHFFENVVSKNQLYLKGIIHLWSLDVKSAKNIVNTLTQSQAISCGSSLYLIQALIQNYKSYQADSISPCLWFITQGAAPIENSALAVTQAPLWGLRKVIALEYPDFPGGIIDLDTDDSLNNISNLVAEILDSQGEEYIALRKEQRYVARLTKVSSLVSQSVVFHSDNTYLITGGLGSLGLKVAQWMVSQGARYLVLVARRQPSAEAKSIIEQLEKAGAKIFVAQADIAQYEDLSKVIDQLTASMPSLKGIVHAAGILDDGILLQQNWERFERVMAPKVQGSWNLHLLTEHIPLDFFVMFSSAAAILGAPGQGNYAAANAFMDALGHYRSSRGLPGLSINWGPWSEAGMAAELKRTHPQANQGLTAIAPTQGLQILQQVLGQPQAQIGVLPIEWSIFKQRLQTNHRIPLFLSEFIDQDDNGKERSLQSSTILQHLQNLPATEQQAKLVDYLQEKIIKVLGLSDSKLDLQKSLDDLGFDSLMAVELSSAIRAELHVNIPLKTFVANPNIVNLAMLLGKQIQKGTLQEEVELEEVIDFEAETVLDPAICLGNNRFEFVSEPTSIFLTGATGFLGAFLLYELLEQTQADIYCLVRASGRESAQIRLQKNLQAYEIWQESFRSRIIPVLGDLAQPQLGLSQEKYQMLATQIDVIYHNGAFLNYIYPYSKLKSANVLGTQEVLRLASLSKIKPVHHISSVAVFDSVAYAGQPIIETDPMLHTEGMFLSYSKTKWVAEKLVMSARDRGLPVCIYRPPFILGHSQTGITNTDDVNCRVFKGCIQMGYIPDLDSVWEISPVDYVSRATVYLSRQKNSLGKAFHLHNPNPLHWEELIKFMRSFGYPVTSVPYETWQTYLADNNLCSPENAIYPLVPVFLRKGSKKELLRSRRPLFQCDETLKALNNSSIVCPPFDAKLLDKLFSYFIRSGFLEQPPLKD